MLKTTIFSLFISLFCVGCGGEAPTTKTSNININETLKVTPNDFLTAINKARSVARDCHDGLGTVAIAPALTWNEDLYSSAFEHSTDLAQSNTFSHNGSGTASDITGSNLGKASYFNDRIRANGYSEYLTIGENIAGGQNSIEEVMTAWLNSPAHCTNIMNSEFKEIGVAVVIDEESQHKIYWTQNFGAKK